MKPNLSSLSDNEINSGKIWTLLRYNKAFQKDVKWFAAKYKTATNKRAKQETRENAKGEFHTKYQEIENINPFAATALQWMFPMPVLGLPDCLRAALRIVFRTLKISTPTASCGHVNHSP